MTQPTELPSSVPIPATAGTCADPEAGWFVRQSRNLDRGVLVLFLTVLVAVPFELVGLAVVYVLGQFNGIPARVTGTVAYGFTAIGILVGLGWAARIIETDFRQFRLPGPGAGRRAGPGFVFEVVGGLILLLLFQADLMGIAALIGAFVVLLLAGAFLRRRMRAAPPPEAAPSGPPGPKLPPSAF